MNHNCLAILLLLSGLTANAQRILTEGFSHPESVVSDGRFIYVTDIGKTLAITERDGDGAVWKLNLDGKVVTRRLNKEPLNAPKGITLIGDKLYLTDIDKVVILNKHTGRKVDEIDLSAYQTTGLNDIEVKHANAVFVSATDRGKIVEISLTKPYPVKELALPLLNGPNGLCYDKETNKLYVVGIDWGSTPGGEIGVIEWQGGGCRYKKLVDVKGYYDGLQLVDKHTLLVSDWVNLKQMQARVLAVDLDRKSYRPLFTQADAADLFYDRARKRLLLPGLREGKLYEYLLK